MHISHKGQTGVWEASAGEEIHAIGMRILHRVLAELTTRECRNGKYQCQSSSQRWNLPFVSRNTGYWEFHSGLVNTEDSELRSWTKTQAMCQGSITTFQGALRSRGMEQGSWSHTVRSGVSCAVMPGRHPPGSGFWIPFHGNEDLGQSLNRDFLSVNKSGWY